ncbi:MAG: hypothetical protein ABIV21_07815 [Pyrinomonadaceae bacterium]
MIKEIEYMAIPSCLEVSNGDAKLIIPTEFGPRVLFYGLDGGENVFGWHPEVAVDTELGTWKPYGGHRLWMAPENMHLSYAPDNVPVGYVVNDDLSITLTSGIEPGTDLQKVITVTLDPAGADVQVDHQIRNRGASPVEISVWALTIMRPGGEAIVPNEPLESYGGKTLLPVRTMALWPYTDFTDPRWFFDKHHIALKCDETIHHPQKFGVLSKQGWAAYKMDDIVFTKRFDAMSDAVHPDLNSNTEIYTAGEFIEVETLSPIKVVGPGECVEHREKWELVSHI